MVNKTNGQTAPILTLQDCLTKHILIPEITNEEGEITQKEQSTFLIKEFGPAVRNLVNLAKLEFGGIPKKTPANELTVWRFLVRKCEQQNMNPTDTRTAISMALPYVFMPCRTDVGRAAIQLDDESREICRRYRAQFVEETPLRRVFNNPLSGRAWRDWVRHLGGLDDPALFQELK